MHVVLRLGGLEAHVGACSGHSLGWLWYARGTHATSSDLVVLPPSLMHGPSIESCVHTGRAAVVNETCLRQQRKMENYSWTTRSNDHEVLDLCVEVAKQTMLKQPEGSCARGRGSPHPTTPDTHTHPHTHKHTPTQTHHTKPTPTPTQAHTHTHKHTNKTRRSPRHPQATINHLRAG